MSEIKVVRLYRALETLDKELLIKWMKKKGGNSPLYILLKMIEVYDLEVKESGNEDCWDVWFTKKRQESINDLRNTPTKLFHAINDFLIENRSQKDLGVLRNMELYYIYRDLGLGDFKDELIKTLDEQIKQTNDLHILYTFEQLVQERRLANDRVNARYTKPIQNWFEVYHISEMLFLACSTFSIEGIHPKKKAFIEDLINTESHLSQNEFVICYRKLYEFVIQSHTHIAVSEMEAFEKDILSFLPKLERHRQRDVFGLFYNVVAGQFKKNKRSYYLEILWESMCKGFEQKFFYIGGKIPFSEYQQFIGIAMMRFEEDKKQLSEKLAMIIEKYKVDIDVTSYKLKEAELLQLQIDYHLVEFPTKTEDMSKSTQEVEIRKRYLAIYHIQAGLIFQKYPKERVMCMLLTLKAGLCLYQRSSDLYLGDFWTGVGGRLKRYEIPEYLSLNLKKEVELWNNMYILETQHFSKERQLAKDRLSDWLREMDSDIVFPNKSWYIGQVTNTLAKE